MMQDVTQNPGFLRLSHLGKDATWLPMCISHTDTSAYLMDFAMFDDLVVDAMIEEDTRSRIRVREDGIMVLLKAMQVRGAAMAEPQDMVSMRI